MIKDHVRTLSALFSLVTLTVLSPHAAGQPQRQDTPRGRPATPAPPAPISTTAEPVITERGPHHRVWTRATVTTSPSGRTRTNTSSVVELGSGIHRWNERTRQWIDASPAIEITPDGAAARSGAHQATFAPNINTPGAITLVTPDGKRLRSHVLGIAFFDASTGRSLMVGELKDSIGELRPPGVVIYRDAFDGISADLKYSNREGSFEQDVVLLENLPLPDGFRPDTTRLEVWTEFTESPAAQITQRGRAGMTDDTLDFGAMQTSVGNAFPLEEGRKTRRGVPIAKRWLTAEGRTFLVEAVRYLAVKSELAKLPVRNQQARAVLGPERPQHPAGRPFPDAPAPRQARLNAPAEKMQMASLNSQLAALNSPQTGLVIDYNLASSLTDFTFRGDTTYIANHTVSLNGTTTFEGGTVVKFASSTSARLSVLGSVVWKTSAYRPAHFTAKDDNSVGDSVGTGNPTGYYGGDYLLNVNTVQHARFSYARNAVRVATGGITVRHTQFSHCDRALENNDVYGSQPAAITMENVLCYSNQFVVTANAHIVGRHVTAHDCYMFLNGTGTGGEMHNSMLVHAGGWGGTQPEYFNTYVGDDQTLFQTVGGGRHYLAPGSIYRNAGGTITGPLATEIKELTTWPPAQVLSGPVTEPITLSRVIPRDNDSILDRGYHYAPLDWIVSGLQVSEVPIIITNGAAIGMLRNAGNSPGIYLMGGNLQSTGTPLAPNRFVFCNAVQEASGVPSINSQYMLADTPLGASMPSLRLRFTEVNLNGYFGLFSYSGTSGGQNEVSHCRFYNGDYSLYLYGNMGPTLGWTNNLFERMNVGIMSQYPAYFNLYNNLFRRGTAYFTSSGVDTWNVRDNIFDTMTVTATGVANSHNAYLATTPTPMAGAASPNFSLTTSPFVAGSLGDYYLATGSSLINAGSRTAADADLYHFTSSTSQQKEENSQVDVGLHYVALSTQPATLNQPVDTDRDSLADYFEDASGNGVLDAGELHFRRRITPGNESRDDITADRAPPLIIITSPSPAVVSQPIIQIQGYSPEALRGVSVTVNGTVRDTFITRRHYDRVTSRLTTNWFQAFDVPLQAGPNSVEINATDAAGNPAESQFSIQLDLAGDHTPPAITHHWPLRGVVAAGQATVSGGKFTLRGRLDDPTASVSVQIQAGLHAGLYNGIVERNGLFWVEDLPLGVTPQELILEARDVAGNVAVNAITVVPSPVTLAFTTPLDLSGDKVAVVNGTINSPNFKVWVNGKPATLLDEGSPGVWNWHVEGIRLNGGGTAILQAMAIPFAANGGNGAVPGVGPVANENMGNPFDASGLSLEMIVDRPHQIRIKSIAEIISGVAHFQNPPKPCDIVSGYWFWERDGLGEAGCANAALRDCASCGWHRAWNHIRTWSPEGIMIENRSQFVNATTCALSLPSPDVLTNFALPQTPRQYAEAFMEADPLSVTSGYYGKAGQTLLEIQTGGKARLGEMSLFKVKPTATARKVVTDNVAGLGGGLPDLALLDWGTPVDFTIQPSLLTVLGQIPPDSQDYFFVSLPDNVILDCTVTTTASQFYDFDVTAERCNPDLDVDSDNYAGPNPSGGLEESLFEDYIEARSNFAAYPGKVIWVNQGDIDRDGVPDYADGIQDRGTDVVDPNYPEFSPYFTPMSLSLPGGVDLSKVRFKFEYKGSSPAALLGELLPAGDNDFSLPPGLPPGTIRVWLKNGDESRRLLDYIVPGNPYDTTALGFAGLDRAWFHVEGLTASSIAGDASVKILMDPDGPDGPAGFIGMDQANFTVLGVALAEVHSGGTLQEADEPIDSHPSPVFTITTCTVGNPRANVDGTEIIGDVSIIGTVRSAACDLVKDNPNTSEVEGAVHKVRLYLNGSEDEAAEINVTAFKSSNPSSLDHPYPFTGSFSVTLNGTKLDSGTNLIRLTAQNDGLPPDDEGNPSQFKDITGFIELTFDVQAQDLGEGTDTAWKSLGYDALRATLDFGQVYSLAELTPDKDVTLQFIAINGSATPPTYNGVLRKTSDSPLVLANGQAFVTILNPAALNSALSGTVQGQIEGVLQVFTLGTGPMKFKLNETHATTSAFSHDYISFAMQLSGSLDPLAPDTITASLARADEEDVATHILTETGADTKEFRWAAGNSSFVVQWVTPPDFPTYDPNTPDSARVLVSFNGFVGPQISNYSLNTYETDSGSLLFATDDSLEYEELEYGWNFGWAFTVGAPVVSAASTGGEMHVYALRVEGPAAVIALQAAKPASQLIQGPDGRYYLAGSVDSDRIGTFATAAAPQKEGGWSDVLTFEGSADFIAGFARGFIKGGASMVKNTAKLAWWAAKTSVRITYAPLVCLFNPNANCPARARVFLRKSIATVRKLAETVEKIANDEGETVLKALGGDEASAAEVSDTLRLGIEWSVELIQEVWADLEGKPPGEKGEVLGRATFEIASFILPFTKPGQMAALGGKLGFIQKLAAESTLFKAGGALAGAGSRTLTKMTEMAAKTPNMCFVAGTPVHTREGLKNIEQVQLGDWVLSRDAETGRQGFKPVLATFVTHPARLYHLIYRAREGQVGGTGAAEAGGGETSDDDDDARLVCTGEHPFFVIGRGFVAAEALALGEELLQADGRVAVVVGKRVEDAPQDRTFTTYNFEVADWHTYFAGQQGVWVHNVAGRSCERIRGLFHRLRGRGFTSKQAFTVLVDDLTKATGKALKPAAVDANKLMFESGADLARSGQGWAQVKNEVMTVHESHLLLDGKVGLWRGNGATRTVVGSAFFRHHSVPEAVQKVLERKIGLPPGTWNYDDVPVMFLTKETHMFPDGVHAFLKAEGLWIQKGMEKFSAQEIVEKLRTAYLNFNDPNGWEVIRAWLKHKNVPFPPNIP